MTPTPRPGILEVAPYVGGEAAIPGRNRVIRLASNENPLGPSPRAMAAHASLETEIHPYPDRGARALRQVGRVGARQHLGEKVRRGLLMGLKCCRRRAAAHGLRVCLDVPHRVFVLLMGGYARRFRVVLLASDLKGLLQVAASFELRSQDHAADLDRAGVPLLLRHPLNRPLLLLRLRDGAILENHVPVTGVAAAALRAPGRLLRNLLSKRRLTPLRAV